MKRPGPEKADPPCPHGRFGRCRTGLRARTRQAPRGAPGAFPGIAPVAPVKSPGPVGPGVHTVAGQRRSLTCFPNILHNVDYMIPEVVWDGKARLWKHSTPRCSW